MKAFIRYMIHLELTLRCRSWSSYPLAINCINSHRVACVSVQSPHYHTAHVGRHLTGRWQCAHSLPLSSLSPPPATSGGCDHHTVRDVSLSLHQGQRLPADPYCSVTNTCDYHATWFRRCCGEALQHMYRFWERSYIYRETQRVSQIHSNLVATPKQIFWNVPQIYCKLPKICPYFAHYLRQNGKGAFAQLFRLYASIVILHKRSTIIMMAAPFRKNGSFAKCVL